MPERPPITKPMIQTIRKDGFLRVAITYPRGDRYIHDHKFKLDEFQRANNFIQRIHAALENREQINFAYWQEIAPAPNSIAAELSIKMDFFNE